MAARSSSSNSGAGRSAWRDLLSWRPIVAGVFAAVVIGLCLASYLREGAANKSPMARSRAEIALGLAMAKRPALMERHWRDIARRDPLQSAAFVIKGIAMMGGKIDAADRVAPLMQAAMERQPSLDQPRIWLAAFHARKGNSDQAISEFDSALARSNGLVEPVLPVLVLLLQDPASRPGMLNRMRAFPRWRTPALIALIEQGGLPQREIEALLAGPAPSGFQPLLDAERQALLQHMVTLGQPDQAYALFRRYVALNPAKPIYDGNFAASKPMQPFGWKLASDSEDYTERVENRAGGWLLRARSSGKRDLILIEQTLGLPAGQWTLTMQARDGGLARPDALTLGIECLGTAGQPALAERALGGLGPAASETALRVTIPEGCGLQRLALRATEGAERAEPSEIEILSFGARR